MRTFKIALATAFVAASLSSFGSVVVSSSAVAAEKKPAAAAPGKCGTGKFFDKKTKKCVAK
jgi:hypothetical protein